MELYWGALERVIYLPLFVGLILLIVVGTFKRNQRAGLLAQHPYFSDLIRRFSPKKSWLSGILLSLATVLLAISVLQPQWGKKEHEVEQEGRDVLVLLDVSRSMAAEDVKPNRLDFTKLKIRKLLSKLSFERIGLVLFSGDAFVQCPLTGDYQTFQLFLDQVSIESVSSGTTSIGNALKKASELFKRSGERKDKLILLITDGEDFASSDDLDQVVKSEGLTVCAWGVGTSKGAPVPIFNEYGNKVGVERDQQGKVAMTRLNEPLLKELSSGMSGFYTTITNADTDVAATASFFESFDTHALEGRKVSEYHDRYPYFLFVAWVLLIVEWLL